MFIQLFIGDICTYSSVDQIQRLTSACAAHEIFAPLVDSDAFDSKKIKVLNHVNECEKRHLRIEFSSHL